MLLKGTITETISFRDFRETNNCHVKSTIS